MNLSRRRLLTVFSVVRWLQSARRLRRTGILAQDLQPGLMEAFRNELLLQNASESTELR